MASITIQGKDYQVPDQFQSMSESQRQDYIMQMLQAEQRANIATETQNEIKDIRSKQNETGIGD